jgi:hypothetical protein
MPSANTKPVAARIPKDHYYLLLREAADRQMSISRFLEDVVIRSYLRPIEKAEKGIVIKEDKKITPKITPTNCIVFEEFPDVIVRRIGKEYSMHQIGKNNKVSVGVIGKQIANGCIMFEGYEVFFGNNNAWNSRTKFGLRTKEVELEIEWF